MSSVESYHLISGHYKRSIFMSDIFVMPPILYFTKLSVILKSIVISVIIIYTTTNFGRIIEEQKMYW